jgi:PKD repeat protein
MIRMSFLNLASCKRLAFFLIFSVLVLGQSFAQAIFAGRSPDIQNKPEIPGIETYDLFEIDQEALYNYVKKEGTDIELTIELGQLSLSSNLIKHNTRKPGLVTRVMTASGLVVKPAREDILYRGVLNAPLNGMLLYAINKDFFAGTFIIDGREYMIEPLWHHHSGAAKNLVIVYETALAKVIGDYSCGVDVNVHKCTDPQHDHGDGLESEEEGRSPGCKEVEYGAALDWLFYNKYGNEPASWDRVDLVMGLVETQYTGWFTNDYIFVRSAEFVSDCSTCDPAEWTNTTNSSTLVANFRNWGQGGGFGNQVYDVASLWTNRNFQNGVVGIAYVGGMCNSFRYNCLMDYSTQNWAMRVMVSHELGHNLNAGHDGGSGFIMSPSVNNTTTWSSSSINVINNYTNGNGGNCMTNCTPQSPPVAGFSADVTEGCAPLTVHFTDESTNSPTSWLWTFPGGTPGSSTMQNPTVTYNTEGTYNVTLVATNGAGSDSHTENSYINITDVPTALWDFIADENIVNFYNLSDGGVSYFWEFGDGNSSTDENPLHVYATDGVYEVELTVTNECGTDTYSQFITIVTSPIADFGSDVIDGCAPLVVEFEDLSTPNTTSWNWQFPGGSPLTSNAKNPVVTYPNPGVYTVTLIAINSAGTDVEIKTNYITVLSSPNPDFTYTVKIDSVFFNSLGNVDSLHWDFGDGGTSSEEDPIHVYLTEGVFDVTLQVFASCGDSTLQQPVTIVLPPSAGFSANDQEGCAPFAVNFMENASPNTTSFWWSFPGGNPSTSTDPNPTVDYATPGIYNVTFVAINSVGSDTLTLVNYITVLADPVAAFDADVNNGNEVSFDNNSQFGTSYTWDFGDGNGSNDPNPDHIYTQEGVFTVTLWAFNACDSSMTTQQVTIVLPPVAGFSANQTSGCAPFEVQFSDQSSQSVTSWLWTFEGGNPATSTDENPIVQYLVPGVYDVKLIVSNPVGIGELELLDHITVFSTPVSDFSQTNNNGTVSFTNQSQYGQSYVWLFGDGGSSIEENPTHTYAAEGAYVVTLTVTNSCGVNIYTELVQVYFAPVAGFGSDQNGACGESMTVQFNDLSQGFTTSWIWTFEGGNPSVSNVENPVVTYSTPGSYDVTLIATGPGGSDTILLPDYITLSNSLPIALFDYDAMGLAVAFTDESEKASSYSWDFGDGNTSSEKNPVHIYGASGSYGVTQIAHNPCGNDTIVVIVSVVASGLELPDFLTRFSIMPNPTSGICTIEMEGRAIGAVSYDIVDLFGRIVHSRSVSFNTSLIREELDLSRLTQGTYFFRMSHEGNIYSRMLHIIR